MRRKLLRRVSCLVLALTAALGLVGCGKDYFERVRGEYQDVPFTTVIFNDSRKEAIEKLSQYENKDKNDRLKSALYYDGIEFGGHKGTVLVVFDQETNRINSIAWRCKGEQDDKLFEELSKQATELYGQPINTEENGIKSNIFRVNGDDNDVFMITSSDTLGISISRDKSGCYATEMAEMFK